MRTRYPGTHIDVALEAHRTFLESEYSNRVDTLFKAILKDLGPELNGVYSSWKWCRTFTATVKPNISKKIVEGTTIALLDSQKVAKNAQRFATDLLDKWGVKIISKLGAPDSVRVQRIRGNSFQIIARMDGRRVVLDQNVIVNISSRGTLFNQFPARIYINGKFVSAAQYKALYLDPSLEPSAEAARTISVTALAN